MTTATVSTLSTKEKEELRMHGFRIVEEDGEVYALVPLHITRSWMKRIRNQRVQLRALHAKMVYAARSREDHETAKMIHSLSTELRSLKTRMNKVRDMIDA